MRRWLCAGTFLSLLGVGLTVSNEARAQENPAAVRATCSAAHALTPGRVISGSTAGAANRFHATCADGAASGDAVYVLRVPQPSHVVVQVQADYDAALHLRANCVDASSELACNDDAEDVHHSRIEQDLAPGTYYVIVDGYNANNAGNYQLQVAMLPSAAGVPPTAGANGPMAPGAIVPLPPQPNAFAGGGGGAITPPAPYGGGGMIVPLPPQGGAPVAPPLPTGSVPPVVAGGDPGMIVPLPPQGGGAMPGAVMPMPGVALPPPGVTPTPGNAVEPGDGRTQGVSGRVLFAKRMLGRAGLTTTTVDRPAPHFVVEALAASGQVVATGETDDQGNFRLNLPAGTNVRVRCVSRTTFLNNDLRVVDDPSSEHVYEVSTDFFAVRGGDRVNLHADVGGEEPAGAFNILAGFVHMLPHVQRGFGGRSLPPLYAFWRRGNNQRLPSGNITAYIRSYRRHPGTYALQIMGGEPGREDSSDSDQFDDPVVLHEFTHFVIDRLSGSFSLGGQHGSNELHMPGLALNEAVASVVAGAVLGDSRYWDTMGVEPNGRVGINNDQESMREQLRGIGSEATGQMIQWDLVDGADGIPDRDNDGIAIGLDGLFRIYHSFHDDPHRFPSVATVLERGVELGLFTQAQAQALVQRPEQQGFTLPLPPRDQYPVDLALPTSYRGKVDGLSQPAPSGGRNVPYNGYDAVRVFRVRVTEPRTLTVRLRIVGDGSQASGTDLDLALMDRNMDMLGVSQGTGPTESVSANVRPGSYIIFVRDGDVGSAAEREGTRGNRADFVLDIF